MNKKSLTEKTRNLFNELESENSEILLNDSEQESIVKLLMKLMSSRVMWIRVLVLIYNFCVNALVYFSLSLNSVSLSGNKYFNFILVSLIEIPGYKVGLVLINKVGRKPGFIWCMILCGITCILCGYAEIVWIQISLFLIGKLGITASFSIIYVHAAGEL